MRRETATLLLVIAGLCPGLRAAESDAGQQRHDPGFRPAIADPAYAAGRGPRVCHDQGHHNFHRLDGRYAGFRLLLEADGYRVEPIATRFERGVPGRCQLLVIANAQPDDRPWDEYGKPTPAAFSPAEVQAVVRWVGRGGRLLLIADHMPLAGAAAALAAPFDVQFTDGFAVAGFETEAEGRAAFLRPTRFGVADGTLRPHAITSGDGSATRVDHVLTFTGQAFRAGPSLQPLLVLPAGFVSLMPEKPWRFTLQTPRLEVGGWLQGGVLEHGRGRVAVFGEAAMFTAQISSDGQPMGLNAPGAEQNARFVRNVLAWLADGT